MEKIDLEAKTDREILILLAHDHNEVLNLVKDHNTILFGNGRLGITTKISILWWVGYILIGFMGTIITLYATSFLRKL